SPWKRAGLLIVFAWFAIGGVCHFLLTASFARIVPPALPAPYALVYISACFELLGALGLVLRPTRRLAGIGLALLTVAVTPANVYMWQHAAMFPGVAPWLLLARLPLQLVLLACIVWSTWQD
ncbi:MAG: DoxX family protein, partial [Janthinobacterium lividum]